MRNLGNGRIGKQETARSQSDKVNPALYQIHLSLFCLKAGFHMIADRGSQIADRNKVCDRLRSYGNTSAIVCDPAIVIADDRRR